MECNNKHCYWNMYDQCCPEDEETYAKATPNELDCPASLRSDFEEQIHKTHVACLTLLNERSYRELQEIYKFIESQRPKE
ncbi:hypothetical protein [Bacillus phage vB_BtM_BMBsp2]|nr:hypothetical protein [Bacillus phage vB_BtM_BMBsp2]